MCLKYFIMVVLTTQKWEQGCSISEIILQGYYESEKQLFENKIIA